MVLENLDRTQWSFAEALAHVETVVVAHRAVEASRLPAAPPRERTPWERPADPQVRWKAEAREQLMVALRDGDLHAQGRYTEERPHAWGGAGSGFGLHSGYHTSISPEQWREARYLRRQADRGALGVHRHPRAALHGAGDLAGLRAAFDAEIR